ncbi:MAG: tetratricopeptide repeat protein [Chlorobi bacterium]|nr:tetratricopeptide repeat protein [Chlorobiota bacterium]
MRLTLFKTLITGLFFVFYSNTKAQNITDSLKLKLHNSNGKEKVQILLDIGKIYETTSLDSSNYYLNKALLQSNKANYQKLYSTILIQLAKNNFELKYYDKVKNLSQKAIQAALRNDDENELIEAKQLLGNAYRKTNITDSAISIYSQVIQKAKEIDNKEILAKALNNLGIIYTNQYKFEKAISNYTKSIEIKKQTGRLNSEAITYFNLGNVYRNWGKFEEANANYQEALIIFEKLNNKNGVANCQQCKAIIYEALGEEETALNFYMEALKIFKETGSEYSLAQIYNNIGILYSKMAVSDFKYKYGHNWDDSIAYFSEYKKNPNILKSVEYYKLAISTYEHLNGKIELTSLYSNLGTLSYNIGDYEKSIKYYNKSINLNTNLKNKNNLIKNKLGIAQCYMKLNNFNKTFVFLKDSYKLAKEIGAFENLKVNYLLFSVYYELTGNYKKSLEYHKKYMEIKDSMFTQEKQKAIFELQTKYETEKKEQEIKTLNISNKLNEATISNQKNIIIFFIIGFLIVAVAAVLLLNLNRKIKKANIALNEKNEIISHQKNEITSSIKYASRIQTAVLPPKEAITDKWPEKFVLFKPRDIVSGDFYWINYFDSLAVIIAADCTGHGVPGAFMSMLGTTFLNEIIIHRKILKPGKILTELRKMVKSSLRQTGKIDEAKDGMDISLCVVHKKEMKLEFAGAYNPLWLFRKNGNEYELNEIKADRNPIGIYHKEIEKFTNNEIQLQKEDTMYIFSDGYADQFGFPDKGKFKTKNFRKLLYELQGNPLEYQKEMLELKHYEWRGEGEQIDDILIIGFKV